ncbi:MAG: hypothetical protein KKF28_01770 [Proteobacteria bacterium]|nr:hypothetical protein [Pseudomonadota bacterium]MBU2026142.1 hypothetical protein [Pseudomonadota bacterium]MBU2234315.1 hypothetical protein [Pseudomonadota bacterium]MBU3932279.1 hypothetical protein [Pseudomonadota bacterium]MBU4074101.1 hypothetical protein [Pseudomonadota bacterium]
MSSTLRTAGTVEVDSEAIYREEFLVPRDAVDANGHVNNVVYLRWMQDVAIRHSDAAGVTAAILVPKRGETLAILGIAGRNAESTDKTCKV